MVLSIKPSSSIAVMSKSCSPAICPANSLVKPIPVSNALPAKYPDVLLLVGILRLVTPLPFLIAPFRKIPVKPSIVPIVLPLLTALFLISLNTSSSSIMALTSSTVASLAFIPFSKSSSVISSDNVS